MSSSVNKVILIGNLGADPEVRSLQDGRSVCNLRLATTDSWHDKQSGERREKTEWHAIVIFNDSLAKIAQQYLKKGAKVYIEGQLQTRTWQDNAGLDRYTTEVVLQNYNGQLTMLDGKANNSSEGNGPGPKQFQSENRSSPPQRSQNSTQAPANKYPGRASHSQTTDWADKLDDELPWNE